jgi:integrase/recombinase XerD
MNTGYKTLLTEYTVWLDTLGYSHNLMRYCEFGARDFLEWLERKQIQHISQLTCQYISEYHHYLETRPNRQFKERLLGVAQLNHLYFANDKFLEFLHYCGFDNAPVPANKRIKKNEQERIKKIEVLTQNEIKTLYNSIANMYLRHPFTVQQKKQYELKLIFALYYGCGLRISEGYNLQLQDIDFDKKTVFVKQGKNYKDRIVPMSAGVYRELQDYVYNFRCCLKLKHNRLFTVSTDTIWRRLKELQNACNDKTIKNKHLTIHRLRHSIATHLLQNGMSIENIALFLGHNSLESTQLYTHLI